MLHELDILVHLWTVTGLMLVLVIWVPRMSHILTHTHTHTHTLLSTQRLAGSYYWNGLPLKPTCSCGWSMKQFLDLSIVAIPNSSCLKQHLGLKRIQSPLKVNTISNSRDEIVSEVDVNVKTQMHSPWSKRAMSLMFFSLSSVAWLSIKARREQKLIMRLSRRGAKTNSLKAPPMHAGWVSKRDNSKSRIDSTETPNSSDKTRNNTGECAWSLSLESSYTRIKIRAR